MQKLKKFAAVLLAVLLITSTAGAGASVAFADESHTSEIMTDVPEISEDETGVTDVTEESSEQETEETEGETDPTEGVTDPTESTEENTEETEENPEETTEPEEPEETTEDATEETTEDEPEDVPQMPWGPEAGDRFVGDINNDGYVNISDATDVQKYIAGYEITGNPVWGDMDGNGIIAISDVTAIQTLVAYGNEINQVESMQGIYDPELGKVENLHSEGYTESVISLAWDAVEGAEGYEIFEYSYMYERYVKVGDAESNSFEFSTTSASGHSVSVRAWYEKEENVYLGNYSDSVNVVSAPSAGIFRDILRYGDGSFAVRVYAENCGSIVDRDGNVLAVVSNDTAVVPAEYEGTEAAVENKFIYGDISSSSCSDYFVIEGDMPLLVANMSIEGTDVTISWEKIEGVSGYEVFKMDENGEYVSIADTAGLSFTESVEYGTSNSYSVKYYILDNGEKSYYSENLFNAVIAPKAEKELSLWIGDTAEPKVESVLDYTLESTDPDVVSVSGKEITAVSSGTAVVLVKGEWEEEVAIEVTVKKAPTELTLSTYNMIILETEGLTINAYLDEGAESEITFTSSDPSKASVDENGFVVAYKAGEVTITAETENGLKAECKVEIYPVVSKTFQVDGVVMNGPSWGSGVVTTLSKGSGAFLLETEGVWNRIRYGGDTGWVYNRSFDTSIKNYTEIDVSSLPVVVDDEIFNLGGPDLNKVFLFVRDMPYRYAMDFGTDEANCVYALKYRSGVCWHHSALFNYMAERMGYEVMYIEGTHYSAHRWTLIHHENGWYHYDATPLYHGTEFVDIYHATDAVTAKWMTWDRSKYPATPEE